MRVMEIPRFPRKIEIPDINHFLRLRLSQTTVMWPDQAIPLVGYMCWPNDPATREESVAKLWSWSDMSQVVPPKLPRIQHEWLRVADVFHHYCDLCEGKHQQRRGGPSLGKAIALVKANARSRGTRPSTLWSLWDKYKDVAHLVTAASLICREARKRSRSEPFGPFGLKIDQFGQFQMAMLMPDFVLAVGSHFERIGLDHGRADRSEPTFDPDTLWHIPPDLNVVAISPPSRQIRPQDLRVLNDRRAGNRGRANRKAPSTS
jgi:hypothetical protein